MSGGEMDRIEVGGAETPDSELARVLGRLADLLEQIPDMAALGRVLDGLESASGRSEGPVLPGWLTVAEAARWARHSKGFIYEKIDQGRLWVAGQRHGWRIYRAHLDEQIARGWPRLEMALPSETVLQVLETTGGRILIPRPRRVTLNSAQCPKLV